MWLAPKINLRRDSTRLTCQTLLLNSQRKSWLGREWFERFLLFLLHLVIKTGNDEYGADPSAEVGSNVRWRLLWPAGLLNKSKVNIYPLLFPSPFFTFLIVWLTFDVFALEIFVDGGGGSSSEPTVGLDFIKVGCHCPLIGCAQWGIYCWDFLWGRGGLVILWTNWRSWLHKNWM